MKCLLNKVKVLIDILWCLITNITACYYLFIHLPQSNNIIDYILLHSIHNHFSHAIRYHHCNHRSGSEQWRKDREKKKKILQSIFFSLRYVLLCKHSMLTNYVVNQRYAFPLLFLSLYVFFSNQLTFVIHHHL
jgi:hypothetical protein